MECDGSSVSFFDLRTALASEKARADAAEALAKEEGEARDHWFDLATYEVGGVPQHWKDRAEKAEATIASLTGVCRRGHSRSRVSATPQPPPPPPTMRGLRHSLGRLNAEPDVCAAVADALRTRVRVHMHPRDREEAV